MRILNTEDLWKSPSTSLYNIACPFLDIFIYNNGHPVMLNNPVLKVVQFWVTEYCIETLYSAGHLLLIVGLLHKNNSNIRHFEVTFVSNI